MEETKRSEISQAPDAERVLSEFARTGERLPGGFFVYRADDSQELLYANRALLRIFDCDTLEDFKALTGYTFRGLVHPDDFDEVQRSIDAQISDSRNDNMDYVEYRVIRKDGGVRWVDDYGRLDNLEGCGKVYYVLISASPDSHRDCLPRREPTRRASHIRPERGFHVHLFAQSPDRGYAALSSAKRAH